MTIKGSCLCGYVRYSVDGALSDADHCHCSLCRKQHGAAFATYADLNPKHFKWDAGEDCIRVYEMPSTAGWCFCSRCGSTVAGTYGGQVTSLVLGSVDGEPGVRPTAHIYAGSKAAWYDIVDDLPQYNERITSG
ncbi:MAG: GFA family protein [Pseudomonadota bacterium]